MPYGLSDKTRDSLADVFRKYANIEQVILYGSRAKGNYFEGSDIDLTLVGDNLDFSDLQRISVDIDQLNLPYLVDISIFRTLSNNQLIDHIKRVGITIYTK
ncbi:nucleotidyltransferase domain-containing protein [Sunxiuqinia rutila]|uniref:nucleotidyltransferase domain-containing protein n=1 Tax=Sunxiuqinia rutila TaxID=1397841 RepID=UPI003D3693B8